MAPVAASSAAQDPPLVVVVRPAADPNWMPP
jgi:hypothetical protein